MFTIELGPKQRTNGVTISIRYKILLIMSILLLTAVGSYMAFAINLFKSDKTAYIYETHSLLTESLGSEVQSLFVRAQKSMRNISQNMLIEKTEHKEDAPWQTTEALFKEEPDFIATVIFEIKENEAKKILSFYNQDFLDMNTLTPEDIDKLVENSGLTHRPLEYDNLFTWNSSHSNGTPLLGLGLKLAAENDLVILSFIKYEKILNLISKSKAYLTYIIDNFGNLLVHPDNKLIISTTNLSDNALVKQVLSLDATSGANEFTDNSGAKHILSFIKIPLNKLILISQISSEKAFLASQQLVKKSVFFALALVGLFFAASIIFSKQLTSAIFLLFEATKKVAQGDFDILINIKSKDEIGSLTESFMSMTKKIKSLLLETADKARMEKELETARLVQETLFPPDHFENEKIVVNAFFAPASECGGDWWGRMEIDNNLYILIGDATGHGVPAALITAAAQSCCTTLSQLAKAGDHFKLSVSLILEALNNAIYESAKGRIKMTFFVLKIDMNTGEMIYSNASHEMPLICKKPEDGSEERSKGDIDILAGDPDNSLGSQKDNKYREYPYKLQSGDVVLLYTDGLTEGRNKEKEEYGEKKLIRSFFKSAHLPPIEIKTSVLNTAKDFYQGYVQEDDITLVILKYKDHEKEVST